MITLFDYCNTVCHSLGKLGKASSHRQSFDPSTAQQAAPTDEVDRGTWQVTYPNGEQLQVGSDGAMRELKPAMICVASDPETRQVHTRGELAAVHTRGELAAVHTGELAAHTGELAAHTASLRLQSLFSWN